MNDQIDFQFFCTMFLLAGVSTSASVMLTVGAIPLSVVWLPIYGSIFAAHLFAELL
ncbi:MAG: hypothetical protein AAF702_27955 [Chloroflexota bacterium]